MGPMEQALRSQVGKGIIHTSCPFRFYLSNLTTNALNAALYASGLPASEVREKTAKGEKLVDLTKTLILLWTLEKKVAPNKFLFTKDEFAVELAIFEMALTVEAMMRNGDLVRVHIGESYREDGFRATRSAVKEEEYIN